MGNKEGKDQLAILNLSTDPASLLSAKTVTIGFDGFIDSVVKVIHHKEQNRPASYFESIQSFGEYIVEKGQKNFSLELEEITTKLGGNMPIMANAFARLGPTISCIGSLGYPAIHPVFQEMPSNCQLYSFANPGVSKVLEFKRGKMMLAEMQALNRIPWDFIKQTIGVDIFVEKFSNSDLIALLNWSELDNSTHIWKGLLRDILPHVRYKKKPLGFFDLSDCSKRTHGSIREAIDLIKAFSNYWEVVLSLNLNEASIVHSVLTQGKMHEEVDQMGEAIYDELKINTVIIHYDKQAVAWSCEGMQKRQSFFIKEPEISTGSGDNFNAGFCAGRLMDLDRGSSLVLGHATSNLYMRSAKSPTTEEMMEFLSNSWLPSGKLMSRV